MSGRIRRWGTPTDITSSWAMQALRCFLEATKLTVFVLVPSQFLFGVCSGWSHTSRPREDGPISYETTPSGTPPPPSPLERLGKCRRPCLVANRATIRGVQCLVAYVAADVSNLAMKWPLRGDRYQREREGERERERKKEREREREKQI